MSYPKRLIEVDLPIKRISAHARKEKSIRYGHISTLHIWWARRPLAACRAILCASLWPDPADPNCPVEFLDFAKEKMLEWSDNEHLQLLSKESVTHFIKLNHNHTLVNDNIILRQLLLDFIADFADWDNSNNLIYLTTARELTQISHSTLGGQPGTNPIVFDPFAGGGSIPLEALRIGADTFASDLNPLPFLINKLQLEYIPQYGSELAEKLVLWGNEIISNSKVHLVKYFNAFENPTTNDYLPLVNSKLKVAGKNTTLVRIIRENPIAYVWARSIYCEGPNCGRTIPLLRSTYLAKKKNKSIGIILLPDKHEDKFDFLIKENITPKEAIGTVKRGNVICPCCGFVTAVANVRVQLCGMEGGANTSMLVAVVVSLTTERSLGSHSIQNNEIGRFFRKPNKKDLDGFLSASKELNERIVKSKKLTDESIIPDEPLPLMSGVFNVPIYGIDQWYKLFNNRQLLVMVELIDQLKQLTNKYSNDPLVIPVQLCLSFAINTIADHNSSISTWRATSLDVGHVFGRQALPISWDYAEVVPMGESTGSFSVTLQKIARVLTKEAESNYRNFATVIQSDAANLNHPDDSADCLFTDPPYYNAVPYSDLSDFFYVWFKRSLKGSPFEFLFEAPSAPKDEEITEMSGWDPVRYFNKDRKWFESQMKLSLIQSRRICKPDGIGIVVFAHKSTEGWEAQLQAMLDAGWVFTASWPIDTESIGRLRALNSAALASSVHLVCRPRENENGILITNQIGDWRDVQEELPIRIHEWMPRLADEGVAGADAIFACLGPALEIFSRYTKVVQSGSEREISLREYLEKVWAAVSQEALNMVFSGGDAQGLEEDARLTAMWLWTLTAGGNNNGDLNDDDDDDDESPGNGKLKGGFTLEYDTARKIAQGLGANLDDLQTLIEVKGDKARLLPVIERANTLFGVMGVQQKTVKRKKFVQLTLLTENVEIDENLKFEMPELKMEQTGKTVLDRLHQAMLLFSAGRTEALRRFLVDDGAGKDDRFWKLAQSLTSLYPKDVEERRWVEAVQTYKKSLGF